MQAMLDLKGSSSKNTHIKFLKTLDKWCKETSRLDKHQINLLKKTFLDILKNNKGYTHKGMNSLQKNFFKVFAGLTLSNIALCTGVSTFIHENIGHLKLGGRMIYRGPKYKSEVGLDYEVFIYQQMVNIDNFKDFIYWFFHIQRPSDNIAGYAIPRKGRTDYTPLGYKLGYEQSHAWISISGPATYYIGILSIMISNYLYHKNFRKISFTLIFLSLSSIIDNVSYAISLLSYTSIESIYSAATNGHDFANFAYRLSKHYDIDIMKTSYLTVSLFTIIPIYNILWFNSWFKRSSIYTKDKILNLFYEEIKNKENNDILIKEILTLEKKEKKKIFDLFSKKSNSKYREINAFKKFENKIFESIPENKVKMWDTKIKEDNRKKESSNLEYSIDQLALLSLLVQHLGLFLQISGGYEDNTTLIKVSQNIRLGEIAHPMFNFIRSLINTTRLWDNYNNKSKYLRATETSLHVISLIIASIHIGEMKNDIYSFDKFFEDIFFWQVILSIEAAASIVRTYEYKESLEK